MSLLFRSSHLRRLRQLIDVPMPRFLQVSTAGRRVIEAAEARREAEVPRHVDARAIRTKLGLSQDAFAARFGIPVATLRDWEQRRRRPEGPGRVLLTIIEREPDAAARALTRR
jgi:putative transcriptional regulator